MWHALSDDGPTRQYTVDGDDDVIALRDDSEDGSRISLRMVDLFAWNETATEQGATVLAIQTSTPGANLRMSGGHAQSEQPHHSAAPVAIQLAKGSILERLGNSRLASAEHDTYGGPNWGVMNWDVSSDGKALDKWQEAVHRCDAAAGPFTLKLAYAPIRGEKHVFVKVDDSTNAITIALNGNTLEGSVSNPRLRARYDKLVLQWDGVEWLSVP